MQLNTTQIQAKIVDIVQEMTQDWDIELEQQINSETQLVTDLSFASIDFIQLVVLIEEEFQQKLGFHDLLMSKGKYVDDIAIAQIVDFITNKLNPSTSEKISQDIVAETPTEAPEKISLEEISEFRKKINYRVAQLQINETRKTQETKNPRAVFLLSPPRSGSTLLRVMLAGNPQLFAPPELHLLSYNTLAQRQAALGEGTNNHLLQGAIRAIVQLQKCSASEAEALMQELISKQTTTKQFYQLLQKWVEPQILVDKTPTYAAHLDILRRAETDFEEPLYLHLLRHPYGTIYSYTEAKLERITPIMNESSLSRQEVAELTWLVSHENIIEFLLDIPANRQMQVKFEDLVSYPETTVETICKFLGIDFNAGMLEPYQDKNKRMTDGVRSVSEMSGDLKFHLHQNIDSETAYRWKKYHAVDFLSEESCDLGESLGYEVESYSSLK
ncbi:MAG: sulfotransferase [Oscillatoria sp. PMC 1068.18]|nr:sulfotransferase [Oscillatoria sp. PMC 1076.18]MEC4987619.1 sulfotransferase [Oscillatoria sp. PMC 1068.18]